MRVDGFAPRHWRSRKKPPAPSIFVDKPVGNLWMAVDKRCTKMKTPEDDDPRGSDDLGPGASYSRMTLTLSWAVTSACSRTGTVTSPSVLIGSFRWLRRP